MARWQRPRAVPWLVIGGCRWGYGRSDNSHGHRTAGHTELLVISGFAGPWWNRGRRARASTGSGSRTLQPPRLSLHRERFGSVADFLLKGRRSERYRDNVRHEVGARLTVSVEDAPQQLEQRLAVVEDHRKRALPAASAADA